MADTYDVVIIGSGPGGYVAAIRAGQLGLKTALVEKDPKLGGTCLHRGCIPTKSLLYTAELYAHVLHAATFGVNVSNPSVDWAQAQKHKSKVVTKGAAGIDFLMKKNKVTVVKGYGRLAGKGKVEVTLTEGGKKEMLETKNVILATGSIPKSLPNVVVDHKKILNSDSILELEKVPKSLIVLGAGAVGVEFASIFAHLGAQVTIIEYMPTLRAHRGRRHGQGAGEAVQAPEDRRATPAPSSRSARPPSSGVKVTATTAGRQERHGRGRAAPLRGRPPAAHRRRGPQGHQHHARRRTAPSPSTR